MNGGKVLDYFTHDPFPDFANGSEKILKEQGSIRAVLSRLPMFTKERVVLLVVQKMQ
jgi:hypothetical protein